MCQGSFWYLFWHWRSGTRSSECDALWVNAGTLMRDRGRLPALLPALSFSSYHWSSAGRWQRTWIHKFSVASERTAQQMGSTRISVTRQLMLPVIDVINNSWALHYAALYSCINQGCIACFLSYFSSWVLQRGASIVNGISGVFLWICLLLK